MIEQHFCSLRPVPVRTDEPAADSPAAAAAVLCVCACCAQCSDADCTVRPLQTRPACCRLHIPPPYYVCWPLSLLQGPKAGQPGCRFTDPGFAICQVRPEQQQQQWHLLQPVGPSNSALTCISVCSFTPQQEVRRSLISATAATSLMACFLMGAVANLPLAVAPGMGESRASQHEGPCTHSRPAPGRQLQTRSMTSCL